MVVSGMRADEWRIRGGGDMLIQYVRWVVSFVFWSALVAHLVVAPLHFDMHKPHALAACKVDIGLCLLMLVSIVLRFCFTLADLKARQRWPGLFNR